MGEMLFLRYMKSMSLDKEVTVWHIAVMMAMLEIAVSQHEETTINVTRQKIMVAARIKGIATYHKYIRQLEVMGYIKYEPSYHPMEGSRVILCL